MQVVPVSMRAHAYESNAESVVAVNNGTERHRTQHTLNTMEDMAKSVAGWQVTHLYLCRQ